MGSDGPTLHVDRVLKDVPPHDHTKELEVSKEEVFPNQDIHQLGILYTGLHHIQDGLLFGITSSVGKHQARIAVLG